MNDWTDTTLKGPHFRWPPKGFALSRQWTWLDRLVLRYMRRRHLPEATMSLRVGRSPVLPDGPAFWVRITQDADESVFSILKDNGGEIDEKTSMTFRLNSNGIYFEPRPMPGQTGGAFWATEL